MNEEDALTGVTTQTIALPRPNLGPEPLPEPSPPPWVWAALATLMFLVIVWLRRRMRQRRAVASASAKAELLSDQQSEVDINALSPRERLIEQADQVRRALVARFGPGWVAKTTEEIASDPELAALIEAGTHAQLVALLAGADRAKFAECDEPDADAQREAEAWLAAVVAALGE